MRTGATYSTTWSTSPSRTKLHASVAPPSSSDALDVALAERRPAAPRATRRRPRRARAPRPRRRPPATRATRSSARGRWSPRASAPRRRTAAAVDGDPPGASTSTRSGRPRLGEPGVATVSAGSSATRCRRRRSTASAPARSRWASARAASPVIHRDEPSAAAVLPSSDAPSSGDERQAGRDVPLEGRVQPARGLVPARRHRRRSPASRELARSPGRRTSGFGSPAADDDAARPRPRSRARARRRAAVVVAGLERAVEGGAAARGPRLGAAPRPRRAAVPRALVPALADDAPSRTTTTAPTIGLGETRPQPRSASASARRMCARVGPPCSIARPRPGRWWNDAGDAAHAADAAEPSRPFPPIPTLTVGPGVAPGPPTAGCRRVADCHRRWGIAPRPGNRLWPVSALEYRGRPRRSAGGLQTSGCGGRPRSTSRGSRLANCFISVATATASP